MKTNRKASLQSPLAETTYNQERDLANLSNAAFLDREWEEQESFNELEENWRKSLPRLSEIEWLEVFPEACDILPDKVREWDTEIKRLVDIAKRALRESISRNFLEIRIALQVLAIPRISVAEKHLARLRHLIRLSSGRPATWHITDADIQRAKAVPIESLIPSNVRRTGKTFVANCPLHNDRSPSFVIYPDNHFHCYGCHEHGDTIALTQKLHGLPFIEAVKYLQRL
jgi:hypothetical protein